MVGPASRRSIEYQFGGAREDRRDAGPTITSQFSILILGLLLLRVG